MADAAGTSAEGATDTPQDLTLFVQNLLDQMVIYIRYFVQSQDELYLSILVPQFFIFMYIFLPATKI